jgi:hypothetical protein
MTYFNPNYQTAPKQHLILSSSVGSVVSLSSALKIGNVNNLGYSINAPDSDFILSSTLRSKVFVSGNMYITGGLFVTGGIKLPVQNTPLLPTIAFGDGNSGIYSTPATYADLAFSIQGIWRWGLYFGNRGFYSQNANGVVLMGTGSTYINATMGPDRTVLPPRIRRIRFFTVYIHYNKNDTSD